MTKEDKIIARADKEKIKLINILNNSAYNMKCSKRYKNSTLFELTWLLRYYHTVVNLEWEKALKDQENMEKCLRDEIDCKIREFVEKTYYSGIGI